MSSERRVQQQPGYILHHRPFRDSSQILDIVTRDYGKVALVARGSRGARSRLAGILRPFLPLRLSWVAKSDLGTLTGAEASGQQEDSESEDEGDEGDGGEDQVGETEEEEASSSETEEGEEEPKS